MTQDRVGAVQKEKNGRWGSFEELPGPAAELWGLEEINEPKISPRILA